MWHQALESMFGRSHARASTERCGSHIQCWFQLQVSAEGPGSCTLVRDATAPVGSHFSLPAMHEVVLCGEGGFEPMKAYPTPLLETDSIRRGRRIAIVGTIGSGKTTLAREVSSRLGIPHVELDSLHWEAKWVEAPLQVFRERVVQSLQGHSWVVDGNYHQVRDIVWDRADTVVWLDYSIVTILRRLSRRTLRRVFTQERLWNGNQEHLLSLFTQDSVFWWALKTYRRRKMQYPALLAQPENSHLSIVRLRSPKETKKWLSSLR